MALTPISLFQSQGSGIAQFLQGGQNALASALNNVIQVGRDTVNKQFAQERDFLGEQKRVEDLAQRRGEVAQQQANLDRSFARNLFVSDRDFADRNADQARAEERMKAEDLFRRTDANRTYDLRKSEAESLQKSRNLTIQEAERQAELRRRDEQFREGILDQSPTGATRSPELTADYLYGPVTAEATATAGTPEERVASASIRMEAAKGRDAKAFTEAAREKAAAEAELRKAGGGNLTAEQRAQERFRMSKETFTQGQQDRVTKAADKAAKEERSKATAAAQVLVESDAKAFPPSGSFIPKGLSREEQAAAEAEAKATDSNRVAVEIQAALDSPTFEDYLIKSVASAEQQDGTWKQLSREEKLARAKALGDDVVRKRRKLYDLAKKTGLGADGTPAATPTTAASEIDRLKGGAGKLVD